MTTPWYNVCMPVYAVETPQRGYSIIVERGCLASLPEHIPARAGKVFFVSTEDVWQLHGRILSAGLTGRPHEVLFFPGGEARKRLHEVEALADQMVERGADRSSIVV